MNETVDLREAHTTLMALQSRATTVPRQPTSNSRGCCPIDPQAPPDAVDSVYHNHYRNLCTTMHPAVAAVMAHDDVTYNRYHRHPHWLEDD